MKATAVKLKSMVPLAGRQVNKLGEGDTFEAEVIDGLLVLSMRTQRQGGGFDVHRAAVPLSEVHCIVYEAEAELPRAFACPDPDGCTAPEEHEEEPSDLETQEAALVPPEAGGVTLVPELPKKKRGKK